jgi:hypothetical protein
VNENKKQLEMIPIKLLNRKYLLDLACLINRKDKRTIKNWCIKSHLPIYRNSSGEFVNEDEFELAYNLPLIMKLKAKYGENWVEYYESYKNGDLYKILNLNTNTIIEKTGYVPKGKLSSKLFGRSPK